MKYLSTHQAAEYLGMASETLRKWRQEGKGPIFYKRGKGPKARVGYTIEQLDAFAGKPYRATFEFTDPYLRNPPK